ncbi:uncharacterized protein F5891DRAFT_1058084 [Suillus fuscotomentosus]|uniref:Uncharacterized protein n=1 Tax=Suillus fuscotomentosus TaxID=1912939 RepID=A0AAD4HGE9_9AGAM|nr:uncharacterized protein F5891DRAFT_1058084 [Suillus fuscotomentosus]KAG1895572.1 hypothetical protein F5891DRAFT_1058084 [Suillus fuscotomentosus]
MMDYVEQPNSNLICCICHAPFTNPTTARTCLHTFCHDCIAVAVQHSPQCPIDRSSLSLDDLSPANPIVKHLVDELIIECPNRVSGCTQTFQRQLLSAHVKDTCLYVEIPCSEEQCDKLILRKDVGKHKDACVYRSTQCDGCGTTIKYSDLSTHNSECPSKSAMCSFCFEEFPRSQSQAHAATCLDYEIPCTQANNGCSWTGPRHQLSDEHVLSCPYEAMKGFFSINSAQLLSLNTENAALRQKVYAFESVVQTMRRDIQTFTNVLGPWYRSHIQSQTPPITPSSINAFDHLFSAPPGPSSSSSRTTTNQVQPSFSADHGELTAHNDIDALAPYFPLPHEHAFQESHNYPRSRRSFSGIVDPHSSQRTLPLTPVAPLNLSTSLEGSLSSLRDSIAAVSTSVDSLARRNDIALTNESMRLNEELGSLKYAVHGIRLQLHRLMMDRNAQVTGRGGEPPSGPSGNQTIFYPPISMMTPSFPGPPGTKL